MDPARSRRKILVYDGTCPFCIRASRAAVGVGLLQEDERRDGHTFTGEEAARLEAAGFRNELLVWDPETGEMRSGMRGILWLARGSWARPIAAVLSLPGLSALLGVLYRFVAANRRVIAAPVPRAVACACDPNPAPILQGLFLVGTGGSAVVLTHALLASRLPPPAAVVGLGAHAALWILAGLAVRAQPAARRWTSLGHLGAILFVGALGVGASWLFARWVGLPAALPGLAAAVTVVRMGRRRKGYVAFGGVWPFLVGVVVIATAAGAALATLTSR